MFEPPAAHRGRPPTTHAAGAPVRAVSALAALTVALAGCGGEPPQGPATAHVLGRQWEWRVRHDNGRVEVNRLTVPAGRPVELTLTSADVIHGFSVSGEGVRYGVLAVPERTTTLRMEAMKPGDYHLYCAEFCGIEHSKMRGKVVALSEADYQKWLTDTDVRAELRP